MWLSHDTTGRTTKNAAELAEESQSSWEKLSSESPHTRISHTKIAENMMYESLFIRFISGMQTNNAVCQLREASKIKPNWHPLTGLLWPREIRMSLGRPPKDPRPETSNMGRGRGTGGDETQTSARCREG